MTKIEKEIAQLDRLIDNCKFDLSRPHRAEAARHEIKTYQAMRAALVAKQVAKLVKAN